MWDIPKRSVWLLFWQTWHHLSFECPWFVRLGFTLVQSITMFMTVRIRIPAQISVVTGRSVTGNIIFLRTLFQVKRVEEHEHDTTSLPVMIAQLTVNIRNQQRDLAERLPHKNNMVKVN